MDQDTELIKQTLQGNDNAFEKIIDRYKGYVFAIILNFIKDHGEAENIAQEVFLQIYTSFQSINLTISKDGLAKLQQINP